MRRWQFAMRILAAFACLLIAGTIAIRAVHAAEIGSRIGNFQLSDISGTPLSLQSYSGKIVVFVFWSFKCPVSLAYNERIEELRARYGEKGVMVLQIASGANETSPAIKANAANLNIRVPVLLDPEGSAAEKLGATHTPSVFIVDSRAILRYKGALDNNRKMGEKGRIAYVENALDSILSGETVPVAETRAFGCSIRSGR